MKKSNFGVFVLSWVCLAFAAAGIGIVMRCLPVMGKVYKKRGIRLCLVSLRFPDILFVRTLQRMGRFLRCRKENLASQEAVIVDIPDYDKKLFESMGVILRKKRILLSW